MSESKHTAGPWTVRYLAGRFHVGPVDNDFFSVCYASGFNDAEASANAEFIVRACNAHDELLEACRRLLTFNEELCDDVGVSRHYPSADFARAAIQKAEGR